MMEEEKLKPSNLKYCRQCRKNMPSEDFLNRTKTGYCIVCKTCRDRQLRRYYEKNDRINQYPYDEKKDNLKIKAQEGLPKVNNATQDSVDNASLELSSVSSKSSLSSSIQYETTTPMVPTSFLQSRYRVVEVSPSLKSRRDVYVAKLLYHRTLFQNKSSLVTHRFLGLM